MQKELFTTDLFNELRSLGASVYQANRTEEMINEFKDGDELSQGIIYKEMCLAGIHPIEARKIEIYHWAEHDKRYPPTPYEKGFTAFVEGTSKRKYNEVVNNKTMLDYVVENI